MQKRVCGCAHVRGGLCTQSSVDVTSATMPAVAATRVLGGESLGAFNTLVCRRVRVKL
jgi:hypothetical protein